ncbi:Uncharacterised protein [Mycobacterium tuberculosis]|nr:Uncharacterised protein [Mycobacterium tuberculosis]
MFVVVFRIGFHHRVSGGDDAGEHVVEPVRGAQRKACRLTFGHPPQIDPGEAIRLLLADDGGIFPGNQIRHHLQSMPEFVCQHTIDGHVAEVFLRDRHEDPSIPGNQVAPRAEKGVDELIGVNVADDRTTWVVGIVGHQLADRPEGALQRFAVDRHPVVLDVVDRQQRQLVDRSVVGVDHRARRSRCVGAGAARTVGRGQTPHPERVVEDGQRPPVDDGRAAGYHDHRR